MKGNDRLKIVFTTFWFVVFCAIPLLMVQTPYFLVIGILWQFFIAILLTGCFVDDVLKGKGVK